MGIEGVHFQLSHKINILINRHADLASRLSRAHTLCFIYGSEAATCL